MFFKKSIKQLIQKEQQGIIKRYLNNQSLWESHLEETKSFIAETLTPISANSAAVLGSGWLIDIPMDFMLKKFKKIYLVDIVHPAQIKRKWAANSVIEFIEHDISGQFEHLQSGEFHEKVSEWPFSADVLISANLLSQLAELPLDFLNKRIPQQKLKQLQEHHLNQLKKTKTAILITDVLETIITGEKSIEKNLIFADISGFQIDKKWTWHFDDSHTFKGKAMQTKREVWALKFSRTPDCL